MIYNFEHQGQLLDESFVWSVEGPFPLSRPCVILGLRVIRKQVVTRIFPVAGELDEGVLH